MGIERDGAGDYEAATTTTSHTPSYVRDVLRCPEKRGELSSDLHEVVRSRILLSGGRDALAYNDGNPGATPVEAEDAGAASWWRPPAPPEEKRRHFAWVKVLVAVVVVLALVAGGLGVRAYLQHSSASSKQAAVRQAYLDWWTAREKAYLALDPSGLKGLMTPAGYKQESAQVQQQAATGDPFRLVADHNLQVAVYSGTPYAAVDDVWADHSVALDPVTHQPVQADPDITIEDSATLRLVGGRWLVGDVVRFGISKEESGQVLSYAAVQLHLAAATVVAVTGAFRHFVGVGNAVLATLNTGALPRVCSGSELTSVVATIQRNKAANIVVQIKTHEDSLRFGRESAGTIWGYDTYFQTGQVVNRTTHRVNSHITGLYRTAYQLSEANGRWTVEHSVTY